MDENARDTPERYECGRPCEADPGSRRRLGSPLCLLRLDRAERGPEGRLPQEAPDLRPGRANQAESRDRLGADVAVGIGEGVDEDGRGTGCPRTEAFERARCPTSQVIVARLAEGVSRAERVSASHAEDGEGASNHDPHAGVVIVVEELLRPKTGVDRRGSALPETPHDARTHACFVAAERRLDPWPGVRAQP